MEKLKKLLKNLNHRNPSENKAYYIFNNTNFSKFKYLYMVLGFWPEQSVFQQIGITSIYGTISNFLLHLQVHINI